ncbi:MAG: sortase, partial [Anaerolineaceae bacterium]|nr:sortase [Anaerolineaceae bacterium]
LDSAGQVGEFTSLAVVGGYPAISYYADTNNDLKFICANDAHGASWGTPQILDSAGQVGEFTSLAVVGGYPAISYYDDTNNDLKFIRANDASGSIWGVPQMLDYTEDVGMYTSLAVVDGNPAISYYDTTNGDLKFIRATNASGSIWGTPQTLDYAEDVGMYTSLAVVDGNPAISYYDDTNRNLKFIRATNASGSSWGTPQNLSAAIHIGMYTSLAMVDGNPAISYFDDIDDNLKFIVVQSVDISLSNGATSINNGDTLNFGATTLNNPVTHTLTIQNNGDATLDLTNLSFPAGFSFTGSFPTVISAGSSEDIQVHMDAILTGIFSGNLLIGSKDTNQSPFTIALAGEVTQDSLETGIIAPLDGSTMIDSEIQVSFNHDVLHDGSAEAANNPINYLLVEDGSNGIFDTSTCLLGLFGDDVQVPISSVTYDDSTYTATLNTDTLPSGRYQLLVCGTASIEDLTGNVLNGGVFDSSTTFTVVSASSGAGTAGTVLLPATGFAPHQITILKEQPTQAAYSDMDALRLQIPTLKVDVPIVGVPQTSSGWDVTWLTNAQAGWLNGSAYPTWDGNTVLTGHVINASGNPGPFAEIKSLKFGDQITLQAYGVDHIYEVRENKLVLPSNMNVIEEHKNHDWITLITCEYFNESTGQYLYRRVVRAVLVDVK